MELLTLHIVGSGAASEVDELGHLKKMLLLTLSYLFSRCKKWGVPIEKIYNKTQREKFAWAIDMAEKDYEF